MSPYIKKILVAVALLGVVLGFVFTYNIYTVIFSPNTSFDNAKAFVYIRTGSDFASVEEQLKPLLKKPESFATVARKKGYSSNIKAGKYAIVKEMSNNDIVNTLRSGNLPVNVSFNNQETVAKLAGRIATQIEADSAALLTAFKAPEFLREHGFTKETLLTMYIPQYVRIFLEYFCGNLPGQDA